MCVMKQPQAEQVIVMELHYELINDGLHKSTCRWYLYFRVTVRSSELLCFVCVHVLQLRVFACK
jgi:hypothetical protein